MAQVTPFDGDLDEYRGLVLAERGGGKSAEPGPQGRRRRRAAAPRSGGPPPRSASSWRRCGGASREAESAVKRHGQEIAAIDTALAEPGLFARDPAPAAVLAKARAEAASALARAEDDWLAASAAFEAAMS